MRTVKQENSNAVTVVDFRRKKATRNSRVTIRPLSELSDAGVPWISMIRITLTTSTMKIGRISAWARRLSSNQRPSENGAPTASRIAPAPRIVRVSRRFAPGSGPR